MKDELLYRIALTMIPELGPVRVKALVDHFGNARSVFEARKKELAGVENISVVLAKQIKEWNAFADAEQEMTFIRQAGIQPLFLTDAGYPARLLHCYDPPSLLYYLGNAHLNQQRIVSIIGTRNHTAYGRQVTEEVVEGLKEFSVLIVSGLAFGIDAIAHKSALQANIPTIGVLAHGLDTMYPGQHRSLAREMISQGGLLTEFRTSTQPDKHNFPRRNRIVAGMADATIVVETAVKGGSMITATLAHDYNRDLFAVPGKISDPKSAGCLKLIQQNKALLFTGIGEFIEAMGWTEKKKSIKKQKELFIELTHEEKIIVDLLQSKESMPIDELHLKSGLSSSSMAAAILNLEMQNIIKSLPGKMFGML